MEIVRLRPTDIALARSTFVMMGEAFEDFDRQPLSDEYLTWLLDREDVWAYAAVIDGQPVGGVTAHELPMTRAETTELFVYDIAVRADSQRRGIGRALMQRLLDDGAAAGIAELWVPADNDDAHALEFYRRIGGVAQPVTIFTYPTRGADTASFL
jgi:aminoglycoside 3-N-acetyltransferase I